MDLNSSHGTHSTQISITNEEFQRNLILDDNSISPFTIQQIELYLQSQVNKLLIIAWSKHSCHCFRIFCFYK